MQQSLTNNLQPQNSNFIAYDMSDSALTTDTFRGKTVMITGSSTGIGKAIALKFATLGANIILHGRSYSEQLAETCCELESMGCESTYQLADFSDRSAFGSFVSQSWNWRGSIDILINNAGGDVLTGTWREKSFTDKLDYLLKVDVAATLELSRAFGKRMQDLYTSSSAPSAGSFSILNMGWDQACQGMAGESGELFSTTKGAVMAMTRSLAQSFAPSVRVNCLAPGWIKTEWGESTSTYWNDRAMGESLMNRWGTPNDVAAVAVFLASDQANFISGQIIPINGGFRFTPAETEKL